MKYLFVTLLISFNIQASNWMPVSKIQSQSPQAYQLESECIKSGEKCLDIGDEPEIVSQGFTSLEDIYLKADTQECLDIEDCDAKFLALVCAEDDYKKIKNLELLQVYCVKLVGKKLSKDDSGFANFKAQRLAGYQVEASIAFAKTLRECGGRVMDLMLVRNQPKNLSVEQVASLLAAYQPIQLQLSSGSLVTAKTAIQSVSADGVIVTESDKLALIGEINKCLGL